MKLRIALDIDDTIAHTAREVVRIYNAKMNTDFDESAITSLDPKAKMIEPLHITPRELYDLSMRAWKEDWAEIRPLAEAKLLGRLAKKFQVDLVTTSIAVDEIKMWLKKHYPSLNLGLVSVGAYANKAKLDYDIYIDDAPYLAEYIKEYPKKDST